MKTTFKPIFSVVIPVYNVAKYINKCLDSVLSQTFKSFEIICVDDGSPDNSVELIKRYNDPRIRIISQVNMGLSAARNTGINASRGMFIALLDSDDYWAPSKLIKHFKHLQKDQKLGISYSASHFIDDNGKPLGIGQFPKTQNISAKDIFCRNPIGNGSAPVLRKSMLNELAIPSVIDGEYRLQYFDENMRQSEDVEFWLRAALQANLKIEGIPEALTYYRVNMSGLSANLDQQYDAWLYSVKQNRRINPEFVDRWFPLASAYQKRYLARRAIQSRNTSKAFRLLWESLRQSTGVLKEEPKRTLLTIAAASLSILPRQLYGVLERFAMQKTGAAQYK